MSDLLLDMRDGSPHCTCRFSSQAAANQAWSALSGRFRYLAPLGHNVVAAQVGGRTRYRLRASGAGDASVCRRLQVAGEACSTMG